MTFAIPVDNSSLSPGNVTYGIVESIGQTLMQAQKDVHDNGKNEVKLSSTSAPSHYNGCELVEFLITVVVAGNFLFTGIYRQLTVNSYIKKRPPKISHAVFADSFSSC